MKRTTRRMSEKTKEKIRRKLAGKPKTSTHRRRIAEGMRRYWETIPEEPEQ